MGSLPIQNVCFQDNLKTQMCSHKVVWGFNGKAGRKISSQTANTWTRSVLLKHQRTLSSSKPQSIDDASAPKYHQTCHTFSWSESPIINLWSCSKTKRTKASHTWLRRPAEVQALNVKEKWICRAKRAFQHYRHTVFNKIERLWSKCNSYDPMTLWPYDKKYESKNTTSFVSFENVKVHFANVLCVFQYFTSLL